MPSLSLFHRVPLYDFEGKGAKRRLRRQKLVAFVAFVLSLGAVAGAAAAWAVALGYGSILALPVSLLGG